MTGRLWAWSSGGTHSLDYWWVWSADVAKGPDQQVWSSAATRPLDREWVWSFVATRPPAARLVML